MSHYRKISSRLDESMNEIYIAELIRYTFSELLVEFILKNWRISSQSAMIGRILSVKSNALFS